jgi:hypothetical protein
LRTYRSGFHRFSLGLSPVLRKQVP